MPEDKSAGSTVPSAIMPVNILFAPIVVLPMPPDTSPAKLPVKLIEVVAEVAVSAELAVKAVVAVFAVNALFAVAALPVISTEYVPELIWEE